MNWPLVSVLVIGYMRPALLRQTVESFLATCSYPNLELILADDGSSPDMQAQMRNLPFDVFVMSPRNRGLGANTNAGLAAAHGEFVLQLQDDWVCDGTSDFLQQAVEVMTERPDTGFLRMTDRNPRLVYNRYVTRTGRVVRIYVPDQRKLYCELYTDTPHFKSHRFIEFVGPYCEGVPMELTEIDMRYRFLAQQEFLAGFIEGLHMFEHIGAEHSHRRPLLKVRIAGRLLENRITRHFMQAYLADRTRRIRKSKQGDGARGWLQAE